MFGASIIVSPASFHEERRRRSGVKYTAPNQLYLDHCSLGSFVDQGDFAAALGTPTPPRMCTVATGGINANASAWEYFNQDPWRNPGRPVADAGATIDGMFAKRMYLSAQVMLIGVNVNLFAGAYNGLGFGSPWTITGGAAPQTERDTEVHFSLRYEPATGNYVIVVINKWAAAGHRRFVKVLGTNATLGLNAKSMVSLGFGSHWELEYRPGGADTALVATIDGVPVGTFTDAADGAGDTPLGDIYANRESVGETIKGAGFFSFLGAASPAGQMVCTFTDFYREIEAHF